MQEHIDWLADNIKGRPFKELTNMFNEHFGTNVTINAIHIVSYRHGLHNGLPTGSKAAQFKKKAGKEYKRPKYRPVGSERINIYGYTEIKVNDPKTWQKKHIVIYEQSHGVVPKGHKIIFADGNKQNFDIDNLLLVSCRKLLLLNDKGLLKDHAELTKTGLLIADVLIKIYDIKNKNKH